MLTLNFTPFPVLETERLLLRELSMNDLETLYQLRTNDNIYRFLNKDKDADLAATKAKIEEIKNLEKENEAVFWVITMKDEPSKMIGNIGYWRMDKQNYRAEVGYLLQDDHWQKGIMKEALKKILTFAFEEMKLHSIEANVNPENIGSAALLESCGFLKEAHLHENYFHNGVFYDTVIYSKINDRNNKV